jgi:diguanylate cyclase (GGDEF)-like protein
MDYTGRITGISILLIVIVAIRTYAYFYLNFPWNVIPLPGIMALLLGYYLGKKYDQLKFYAEKDSLTNLYNRRFMYKKFARLFHTKKSVEMLLLIFDCDNFKNINDIYGHLKGDTVLIEISNTLLEAKNKSDIIARWGGDEFLMLVFNSNEKALQQQLNSIELNLQILSQKLNMPITLSSGYARYLKNKDSLDDLIRRADQNMYHNKNNRKNFL